MRAGLNASMEAIHRKAPLECMWEDVREPGAYVERGTGDLYRFLKEGLIAGGSPAMIKESRGASRLVQISKDPFVMSVVARLRCAQHNIRPNF